METEQQKRFGKKTKHIECFYRSYIFVRKAILILANIFLGIASSMIYNKLFNSNSTLSEKVLYCVVALLVIIAGNILFGFLDKLIKSICEYDNETIICAFNSLKKVSSEIQERTLKQYIKITDDEMASICVQNIKDVVESCYDLFDSRYTTSKSLVKAMDFEATFMTISYKDNYITIPASFNKERRAPHSMLKRDNNKEIYDGTETWKIYNQERENETPRMIIIEDSQTKDYKSLYPNQKERIKSSIILPIFSPENKLLGTLVVHCKTTKFFRETKRSYWRELLEIFSVEIGKQKIILDKIINKNPAIEKPF